MGMEISKNTLLDAAFDGDIQRVREFLTTENIDGRGKVLLFTTLWFVIDFIVQTGETALMCAAALGHYEVLELLIESGASVNLQDEVFLCMRSCGCS